MRQLFGAVVARLAVPVVAAAAVVAVPPGPASAGPAPPQGTTTQLTTGTGEASGAAQPAVSADGGTIVFDSVAAMDAGGMSDGDPRLYAVDRTPAQPVTALLDDGEFPIHGAAPAISDDAGLVAYRSGVTPPVVALCVLGAPAGTRRRCAFPSDQQWPIAQNSGPTLAGNGSLLAWPQPQVLPEPEPVRAVPAAVSQPAPPVLVTLVGLGAGGVPSGDPTIVSARLPEDRNTPPDGESEPRLSGDGTRMVLTATYRGKTAVVGIDTSTLAPGGKTPGKTVVVDAVRLDGGASAADPLTRTAISHDGGTVAFTAGGAVWTTRWPTSGPVPAAVLSSVTAAGAQASAREPSLSADGRYLAFVSEDVHRNGGPEPVCSGDCPVPVVRDLQIPLPFAAELVSPVGDEAARADTPVVTVGARGAEVVFASGGIVGGPDQLFVRHLDTTVAVSALDLGRVPVGAEPVSGTVTVTRTGIAPRTLGPPTITGPDAASFAVTGRSCDGTERPEGDGCTFTVTFTPKTVGTRSATLEVPAVPAGPAVAPLTAVVQGVAKVVVEPAAVDMGTGPVGAARPAQEVTVRNKGTAAASVGVATVSGPGAGAFSITDGCADKTLVPEAVCHISVAATPRAEGPAEATLTVAAPVDDGGGQIEVRSADAPTGLPATVRLTVVGAQPQLSANPPVVSGGRVTAVRGVDFPVDTDVTLSSVVGPPRVVHTDAAGAFTVQMFVVPGTPQGPTEVLATFREQRETAPLLIVPGTLVAPDFVTRH